MAAAPLNRIRLATLLFPPAGLLLLWRSNATGLWRKLVGTLGILLYSLLYAALVVLALMQFAGLEIEWRGGFPPVLTFRKTRPDYAAVEAHRARQTNQPSTPPAPRLAPRAPYWTEFRGPNRDGRYAEMPVLTNWPPGGLRLLWKQPVGGGYASFAVADGLAFTIEQRRDREAVTAYEVATGREVWAHGYPARFFESMGDEGPRATPTWHEGRVYALGAAGDLRCLAATNGLLLWARNILTENRASNLYYGTASSPLIVDEKVIVLGGEGARSVLAYHKVTGAPVWQALPDKQGYMSPMLVTLAGRRQVLITTGTRAVGLAPEDGALLWSFDWPVSYDINAAQPLVLGSNRFLISAGYGVGCAGVEVTPTGAGFTAHAVWRNRNLKNKFTSSVLWEGYIYGLDEDILTCLDAATGERQWKDGRYGYGQVLLAAGRPAGQAGHLIVLSGSGELALVKATPERHLELARFPAITGKTWNHPALAGGKLLVRNAVEMACFDVAVP
jgi:outer membrane protein assembly factor BamB